MSAIELYKDSSEFTSLIIENGPSLRLLKALESEKFDRLVISDGDWSQIDFLLDYSEKISNLRILSECDWSVISRLDNLKKLHIIKPLDLKISFENLNHLEDLRYFHTKHVSDDVYRLPNLHTLKITYWKEGDFTNVSRLEKLKKLALFGCNFLESTKGLEELKHFEYLSIERAPKLSDLSAFNCMKNLKTLKMHTCKSVKSLSAVAELKSLEKLFLHNLTVDSISPLTKLTNLRELNLGGCKILDLDLQVAHSIPNLKSFLFQDKKGYNLKSVDAKNHWNRNVSG